MKRLRQIFGLLIISFGLTMLLTFFMAGCDDNLGKFKWEKMPEYIGGSALCILGCAACIGLVWGMSWGAKQFDNEP